MAVHEDPLAEPGADNENIETPKPRHRKRTREYEDDCATKESKIRKGALLAMNKPSYCLKRGLGSLQWEGESLRSQHRKRLWVLLKKLFQRHNWAEASGVFTALLIGTLKDQSISRNRAKYSAALELLHYVKGEILTSRRVQNIYDLWMKKIGPLKNWSSKNRLAVQLEFIIFCLQRGSTEDAHQAALCLMQEHGFDSDPISNLVVGLTFYQRWYSGIPEELQLAKMDSSGTYMQSQIPIDGIQVSIDNSQENDAREAGADSPMQSDFDTSVANDKVFEDDGHEPKESVAADEVSFHPSVQPEERDMDSAEAGGNSNGSLSNYSGDLPRASIFYSQGLPGWLLPMKLPNSQENLEEIMYKHRKLQNDYYKSAVKHLRVALYATPPMIEAFHPLMQLLLLGDQVNEAFNELTSLSHSSDTILQLRVEANLLEHFDGGNHAKLCTCFENILKKDPTCRDTLTRLVFMHRRGDYDTENLAEMIALHLDATYGIGDTWKELASCFLKLSQCEGDRASACYNGSDRHSIDSLDNCTKIPDLFTDGESGKSWRFRCRWWLNRHFHNNILMSEIASGDLELLTYKAAAASHLYGRHFNYVEKVTECLEKEDNMELYSFLQMQILNSTGFYTVKRKS